MPEQPLPANWTEEVDVKGRRFYSNCSTKTIQWEPPAPEATPLPHGVPTPYSRPVSQAPQALQPVASTNTANCKWTPRVRFWVAAATVLPVWIVSVSAGIDDRWITSVPFSAVDLDIIDECSHEDVRAANKTFCDLYFSFMVMQLDAVLFASVTLGLLLMAMFAPASGWCCSVRALGISCAYGIAVSALFQMASFALVVWIAHIDTDYFSDDADDADNNDVYNALGRTFWVAVVAFVLALFDAIFLRASVNSAGNGLIYECTIGKIMTRKANGNEAVTAVSLPQRKN